MFTYMIVTQIPSIFVCHPLSVSEDGANGTALAFNGRLVAAKRLQSENIVIAQLERCIIFETLRYCRRVVGHELLHFVLAWSLRESGTGLVRDECIHASVHILGDSDNLDILRMGKSLGERNRSVIRSRFLIRKDALDRRNEMRVSLQQMATDLLSIAFSGRCNILEGVFQNRRCPFVQKFQRAFESTAVLLNLEEQRLYVFLVFVVVCVDRGVAH